jgi:hypothetical protein
MASEEKKTLKILIVGCGFSLESKGLFQGEIYKVESVHPTIPNFLYVKMKKPYRKNYSKVALVTPTEYVRWKKDSLKLTVKKLRLEANHDKKESKNLIHYPKMRRLNVFV